MLIVTAAKSSIGKERRVRALGQDGVLSNHSEVIEVWCSTATGTV